MVKQPNRTKSILKNRGKSLIDPADSAEVPKEDQYGGRSSIMVEKIKDIDGKMITSEHTL